MKNWKDTLVKATDTVRYTIEVISRAGTQLALVIDEKGCLLGTVADGDIRTALVRGVELKD